MGIAVAAGIVALIAAVAIVLATRSGGSSGEATEASVAEPTYRPPAALTRELRKAGLNPAKFRTACENQNYERLNWFQGRVAVSITCRYHAGVDLDTGTRFDPPGPHYEVTLSNRDMLRAEFGTVPSALRPICLTIAREFRASMLRGAGDADTYWEIAKRYHRASVVAYIENGDVYSGSRLDPCIRFADVDPWGGAAPYFMATGQAKNDRDGLTYQWS